VHRVVHGGEQFTAPTLVTREVLTQLARLEPLAPLYVINALFLAMPKTSEDLGQLWGWSTFSVAKGGLENPEQRYADRGFSPHQTLVSMVFADRLGQKKSVAQIEIEDDEKV
jgi:hypothetical protein